MTIGPATRSISSQPPWWASTAAGTTGMAVPAVTLTIEHHGTNAACLNDGVPPRDETTMREQVLKTIEVIRPALQADGGDIVLRDVDEESGVVTVTLTGACVGCPASTQTLKAGIERIMRDRVDGVTEVVNVEEVVDVA